MAESITRPPPVIRAGSRHSEFNQELPKYTKSTNAVFTYGTPLADNTSVHDANPPAYQEGARGGQLPAGTPPH
jgi:hypothetical protein